MTNNKIKLVFSLIGGGLLICVHYLGSLLFYIVGLIVPLVYVVILFSAMYYAKKKGEAPLTFAGLFKINLAVSCGMVIINFLFLTVGGLIISSIQESILVFLFNLVVASILSGVCAYLFVKLFFKSNR